MSSYSTDLVIQKLSNLNESQDSITSVSQCIAPPFPTNFAQGVLFHRRAANETVQTWLQCLREGTPSFRIQNNQLITASSSGRKLNLIYLANEVVQQSKARKKDDFPKAFGGIIGEAMELAYRGVTLEIQGKLRRVLDVWRARAVFEINILSDIDSRLESTWSPTHN